MADMSTLISAKETLQSYVARLMQERKDYLAARDARHSKARADLDAAQAAVNAIQSELDADANTMAQEDQQFTDFVNSLHALPSNLNGG
jgi:hypothetical protein